MPFLRPSEHIRGSIPCPCFPSSIMHFSRKPPSPGIHFFPLKKKLVQIDGQTHEVFFLQAGVPSDRLVADYRTAQADDTTKQHDAAIPCQHQEHGTDRASVFACKGLTFTHHVVYGYR